MPSRCLRLAASPWLAPTAPAKSTSQEWKEAREETHWALTRKSKSGVKIQADRRLEIQKKSIPPHAGVMREERNPGRRQEEAKPKPICGPPPKSSKRGQPSELLLRTPFKVHQERLRDICVPCRVVCWIHPGWGKVPRMIQSIGQRDCACSLEDMAQGHGRAPSSHQRTEGNMRVNQADKTKITTSKRD